MQDKTLLGYRVIYEFKIDVSFKMRKHFIVSQKLTIEGEDDACVKLRGDCYHSIRNAHKSEMLIGYEDRFEEIGNLVRAAIKENFNADRFSFRIFVACRKPVKEYRFGNYIISITKCEVQKIRDQRHRDLAG